MKAASANQIQVGLDSGVTAAGRCLDEVAWNILGHTYYLKAEGANVFAFETYNPLGTFVPPHIHPMQDEFICVLENGFDLYLVGQHGKAHADDLVRLPAGIPHGHYNLSAVPKRTMFWVAPGRRLRELFDILHNMADPEQMVREASRREVHFLKPEDYVFDPLARRETGQP